MKALTERLEWVRLGVNGELLSIGALDTAVDEVNCSIAIAEVIGMKPLIERLEFIRNYLAGEHSDKKAAMDRMIECLAIAEVLPVFELTPSQPPAGERSIPERVTYNPDRDGNCLVHYSRRGPATEAVYTMTGTWGEPIVSLSPEEADHGFERLASFDIGDTVQVFGTGEMVRVVNPDDPTQWVDIQKLGVRLKEPPSGEDAPEAEARLIMLWHENGGWQSHLMTEEECKERFGELAGATLWANAG